MVTKYMLAFALLFMMACGGESEDMDSTETMEQDYQVAKSGSNMWGTQTNYPYRQCHSGQSNTQQCRFACSGPNCGSDDTFNDPQYVIAIDNTFPTATRDYLRTILGWVVNSAGGIVGLRTQTCGIGGPGPGVEPGCAVFWTSGNNEGDIVFTRVDFPTPHVSETNYVARYTAPSFQSCSPELVENGGSPPGHPGVWKACKVTIGFDDVGIHNIDPNNNSANRLRQAIVHNILKAIGLGQVDNAASYRNRDFKPSVWNMEPSLTTAEKCAINWFADHENQAISFSDFCGSW